MMILGGSAYRGGRIDRFLKVFPPVFAGTPFQTYNLGSHYDRQSRSHSRHQASLEPSINSPHSSFMPRKFVPVPFQYHEHVELVIDDITNLGLGLGRVTLADNSKWVVMVPNVLVGEKVRVKIYKNFDSYSEGDLLEVLEASADRVVPPCKYFDTCGGCQYQHMTIDLQRKWKKAQVGNALRRIGGIKIGDDTINEVRGTDQVYGYRTKITPHYDAPRNKALKVGFQQRGTRSIIDIDQCMIASRAINTKYAEERARVMDMVQRAPPKKGASLLLREADYGYVETDHRKIIIQTVLKVQFKIKAGEFFQTNPHVLPLMVAHVLTQAIGNNDCKFLIDTYCGSGLFSLCGAKHFQAVYGVEVSTWAVQSAAENAALNNISNARFIQGQAESIFQQISHLSAKETVVVIDPPRKGCDDLFLSQLFVFKPRRLVYVSCDPATQARDVKAIVEQGYQIKDVTPFDLFPQTRHIENVITFILD